MEEKDIPTFDNEQAREFAKSVSDKDFFAYTMRAICTYAKLISWEMYTTGSRLHNVMEHHLDYSAFCTAYMAKEQVSLAESQKQLAEQQTKIAERQEDIAKRIEQGSDRTMKLTKRITCLTYVLVAVGIITFVAVCVQIAIEKKWL